MSLFQQAYAGVDYGNQGEDLLTVLRSGYWTRWMFVGGMKPSSLILQPTELKLMF